jgi:DNA-binding MarR family transcriptional regulator
MAEQLTQGEASTWRFIQKLTELAQGVVESEIRAAADLSTSEFEVLRCLLDRPDRQLRQNELAAQLGWDKSRLSHQLTRMEHRQLIERKKAGRIHAVTLTRLGQQKFELAGLAHVTAVRALLVDHLSSDEREALLRTAVLQADEQPVEAAAPTAKSQPKSGASKRVLRPRVG